MVLTFKSYFRIISSLSALDSPNLCQLADEETPTSTSGNLGASGRVVANQ